MKYCKVLILITQVIISIIATNIFYDINNFKLLVSFAILLLSFIPIFIEYLTKTKFKPIFYVKFTFILLLIFIILIVF